MNFETVERCGRVYVVKNGVESAASARQDKGIGSGRPMWTVLRPYVKRVTDTRDEALELIAEEMGDWYTVGEAAERLVELGAFNEAPATQMMSRWAREVLFPGAVKVPTQGRGGSWRIPAAALVEFAEGRER